MVLYVTVYVAPCSVFGVLFRQSKSHVTVLHRWPNERFGMIQKGGTRVAGDPAKRHNMAFETPKFET
jgi:hypothetical protein